MTTVEFAPIRGLATTSLGSIGRLSGPRPAACLPPLHAGEECAQPRLPLVRESKRAACRCGFTCRDIEGQLWNFGTYDPWDT
jgi:hypothetical protein